MVTFVIITNLIISVVNFYLAWRIWQLRPTLVKLSQYLALLEKYVEYTLLVTPLVIQQGRHTTKKLSQSYRKLLIIINIVQKFFLLWNLSRRISFFTWWRS